MEARTDQREPNRFLTLGDPPFPESCRDAAIAELRAAGIPRGSDTVISSEFEVLCAGSDAARMQRAGIYIPSVAAEAPKEWMTLYTVKASAFGWTFRRAWYYWVCGSDDEPLPFEVAEKLHAAHGKAVRVNGSCVCPAPTGDVDAYHVDTPAGLKALVDVLREQHELRRAERQRRFERAP